MRTDLLSHLWLVPIFGVAAALFIVWVFDLVGSAKARPRTPQLAQPEDSGAVGDTARVLGVTSDTDAYRGLAEGE